MGGDSEFEFYSKCDGKLEETRVPFDYFLFHKDHSRKTPVN